MAGQGTVGEGMAGEGVTKADHWPNLKAKDAMSTWKVRV